MSTDVLKEKFEGTWKLYKNENIDAFFSDVGKYTYYSLALFIATRQLYLNIVKVYTGFI